MPKVNSKASGRDLPELALADNILVVVQRDIAAMGLVGEENNALLTYLVYCSRVLKKPGAVITRGPTDSGKSTVLSKVFELFPPAVKIKAAKTTPAAWFRNPDPNYYKHKAMLSSERMQSTDDKTRDEGQILRELLSEHRVDKDVSVPDPNGDWITKHLSCKGPVAYSESTTAGSIFEEDLNRMLQLYVDDSVEQDGRVHEVTLANYSPDGIPVDTDAIVRRHHAFQQYLQETVNCCQVGIPYYKELAAGLPKGIRGCRRLGQQVATVIEAIVVVNQNQRELSPTGRRLATFGDYGAARKLLMAPLHAALGSGKDWLKAKQLRAKLGGIPVFTQEDVTRACKYESPMGASNLLADLRESGLVVQLTKGKKGSPATYAWADEGEPVDKALLPTVKEIHSRWSARRRGHSGD